MRCKGLTGIVLASFGLFASALASAQGVRFSEIHYDNAGTDTGEAIEVAGPAGTDLTGWRVVLYNGSNGLAYDTKTLSGPLPASCGARGVAVINYPANGIQNGSPDAMALVDAGGAVVEFLSYEGTMAAADGPAMGLTASDIGVLENGNGPVGESLARKPDGTWNASAPNSFGACNDQADTTPPAEVVSVTVAPAGPTLSIGGTLTLAATALDSNGQPVSGATFTWSSSAPGVATVSGAGVVTAITAGDASVSATAGNGVAGATLVHVGSGPGPSTSAVRFSELHYDNAGNDSGEAIEVSGPPGTDLTGYSIVLYNGNGGVPYNTQSLSGVLPVSCEGRGVAFVSYPPDGIQNGAPDGMALIDNSGAVVEFLSYEGVFAATTGPAAGLTSIDIGASQNNAVVGTSLQRDSTGAWHAAASTFGSCNADGNGGQEHISFTGRTASDPPLPVGFQDQLFARLADANNQTIPSTFVYTSDTPATASIDQNGVFTALAEGSAVLRATAADGTTDTITLPTHVAMASSTALYGVNAEFGEPTDADPSDDYLVHYPEYTASYNPNRGTPNWVAYDLNATHFGAEDRCDCFTMDPALPASFTQLTTDDYTNAAAIAGYGIDRGHMTRSFDRTSGSLDNAYTYLFDNVVPQASDLNQGPWAMFENFLGDEARVDDKEVYIIAGVAGNKGTLKNLGRVVIPASTWKVAVIMPRGQGLRDVHDYRDLQVIAVNMPNEAGVRNVDWHTYLTTVDAIETLTGYDLLALLPDEVEAAVESNTQPPIASVSGPASLDEGNAASFSAAASVDPNGSIVSYDWDFGDGTAASGVAVNHVFAQDGVFVVRVTTTDNDGLTGTASLTVSVANVAPVVSSLANASVNAGGAYTVSGSFTDPGADRWTASVDWGDGSAPSQALLNGHDFSLVHVYGSAGTFTVTVTIADDDASGSATGSVTVNSPASILAGAPALIDQLVQGGRITRSAGNLLKAEIAAAQDLFNGGKPAAATVLLRATVAELDLLVRLRVLTTADVSPLRSLLLQAIGSARQ
jgi:DNA/RNA endonuclease G (NUC1)